MEVLRELEKRLGIKPLNFDTFLGDLKISSLERNQVEIEKPKVIEKVINYNFTQEHFKAIANSWGVEPVIVQKLYNQVKMYYEHEKTNSQIKDTCFEILTGLYYNNLSRTQVNGLIQRLRG